MATLKMSVTETSLPLNQVAKGDFVKRTPDAKTVWIKGDYDKASKSFQMSDAEDMNREMFIKATKVVFVGFTY